MADIPSRQGKPWMPLPDDEREYSVFTTSYSLKIEEKHLAADEGRPPVPWHKIVSAGYMVRDAIKAATRKLRRK